MLLMLIIGVGIVFLLVAQRRGEKQDAEIRAWFKKRAEEGMKKQLEKLKNKVIPSVLI